MKSDFGIDTPSADVQQSDNFVKKIKEYQKQNGLKEDGIIGPLTFKKLTKNLNKSTHVAPESVLQPSFPSQATAKKKETSTPASVPSPVFVSPGNVQTVEFAGWSDGRKTAPPPEKPQNVVIPSISPKIVETTRGDPPVPSSVEPQQPIAPPVVPGIKETPEVATSTIPSSENDPSSERRKILGDNVSIGMTRGTNKILKNKTPNDEFVAVSERGTIYIGAGIKVRHDSEQSQNIIGSDMEIRLDNEGYVQEAKNVKKGFTNVPVEELKKYVQQLNAMGVNLKRRNSD